MRVEDLRTSFFTPVGEVKAVGGVSFELRRGEVLGIVGESGSGKSVTMLSLLRLLGTSGRVVGGSIVFDGTELTEVPERRMADLRGRRISMIFQDPMTSLNPVLTIGYQLEEPLRRHGGGPAAERRKRALEMLRRVGIEPAEHRIGQYPHQFSGEQRQRIMILKTSANCSALRVCVILSSFFISSGKNNRSLQQRTSKIGRASCRERV